MTAFAKGLVLCAIQTAMVLSIGGKMLMDRASSPRIWVRAMPVDPNLPFRGRYVRLTIDAEARGFAPGTLYQQVSYSVEDGKLVARPTETDGTGARITEERAGPSIAHEDIAYFIPEAAPDPSRRAPGEELWAEVKPLPLDQP